MTSDVLSDALSSIGRVFRVSTPNGELELDAYTEEGFRALSNLWTRAGWQRKLSYEVSWLGIPIIQLPEDIVMMQELVWKVRPDVIVETGVAHGGALVLYASILELLGKGRVVGVDIEIRKYNRLAIESHPLSKRITMIEGDSIATDVVAQVQRAIEPEDVVLIALDSHHSRDHVLAELELYAPLVTPDSYIVVFDSVMTQVADAPSGSPQWDVDNPLAATKDFLAAHDEFVVDASYNRLAVSYCHGGFLRRRAP